MDTDDPIPAQRTPAAAAPTHAGTATPRPEPPPSVLARGLAALRTRWSSWLAELLVIMVGILAAFALENWGQQRAREREQLAILRSALGELKADLEDVAFNVRVHEQAVRSMDLLDARLAGDAEYHDSLAAHFHNALNMPRFVHSTAAFQSMQSAGMDIITNEALRLALFRLYGANYANYRTAEEEQAAEITYGLRHVMPGRFEEGYRFEQVRQSYGGRMVPLDFPALRRDREYRYYLRTLRNRTDVLVRFHYRNLGREIESVRDLVQAELRARGG